MRLLRVFLATAFIATPSISLADFCDAQSDPKAYPARFSWAGQIYGDPSSDFLYIPSDLISDGDLDEDEAALLTMIVDHLSAQGTNAAFVIPVPRLVTASEAYGVTQDQIDAVEAGYRRLLTQLNDIGFVTPNPLDAIGGNAELLTTYNLPKDTHWSPVGTLQSAMALRSAIIEAGILDLDPLGAEYRLGPDAIFELEGGLARMLGEVCPVELPNEAVTYSVVEQNNGSASSGDLLFGDVAQKFDVLLVGTSFTNKENNDVLLWSDSIRYSLQVDPTNIGVPGGEMYTSMLHYALKQEEYGAPELLVWEALWTHRRNDWSEHLRMIYGELIGACTTAASTVSMDLPQDAKWTELFSGQTEAERLSFVVPGLETGRVRLRVTYPDGDREQIKLVRKDRLVGALEHPEWTVFLGDLNGQSPEKIEFQVIGQSEPMSISASVCAAPN